MWFSLDPPERRRRRRPSHATIVAYLALVVAVAGGTGAAVAATVIHTRNIADGAVTAPKIRDGAVVNPKIRNDAVGNHKLRNDSVGNAKLRNDSVGNAKLRNDSVGHFKLRHHAVTGVNVRDNSLTGRQIDESTLHVARVVHQISGSETVPVGEHWIGVDYPLTQGNPYHQPAHTADLYFGTWQVHFPADCLGYRWVRLDVATEVRAGNHWVASDFVSDHGTGEASTVIGTINGAYHFAGTGGERHLTAFVYGDCEGAPGVRPLAESVTIHVGRCNDSPPKARPKCAAPGTERPAIARSER